jgi:arginase
MRSGRQDGPVDLIACPNNSAGTRDGVARMPQALLDAGLAELVPGSRTVWVDLPDPQPVRGPAGMLAEPVLAALVPAVAERVGAAWTRDVPPIVIGGDCPVLLGALVAGRERWLDPALVFVDGHEDAWDPAHSPGGEAADSEIGLALGSVPPPAGLAATLPCLGRDALVQLGPRDANELAEAGQLSLRGEVALLPGDELAGPGGLDAAARLTADLIARHPRWWLHVDLDVLSTEALPAVDYPQPGGLTWAQLDDLTGRLVGLGGCLGLSVCIYNPDLDGGRAAPRIAEYVAATAASLRGGWR